MIIRIILAIGIIITLPVLLLFTFIELLVYSVAKEWWVENPE